ncbi:HAD family hydrolase [Ruminococcus sp.]|uniref:haloacid dehalogenase-like hydrolase n=1 Tax=Ruminococcus sp. TaxID=41978 RepID=UPI0025EC74F0|nr:HAD family hydrolase [Ruminococcus sp.]MBQ8966908.1 haloacid dehalogenase-like hydrolase [Ruminococcus sp.]
MKNRIFAAVAAMVLVFSMSACGSKEEPAKEKSTEKTAATTTVVSLEEPETTTAAPEEKPAETEAPAEDEEPTPEEEKAVSLEYWTEGSEVAKSLVEYVEAVTDPDSDKFIPEEERIVVSDLDGTLIGELYPTYFDHCIFVHRALYDDTYDAPEDMKEFAREVEKSLEETGKLPDNCETTHAKFAAEAYKGMTVDELKDYAKEYLKTEASGFENLTRGDAYYKPMKSLVDYLEANGFTFYVVSGTDRTLVRAICEEMFGIPANHVIGTDTTMVAEGQGDTDGLDYMYRPDDEVVFGGEYITKNLKMNKVAVIAQEIGMVPVLALGNSSGDLSMAEYVTLNDKYEGRAYLLLCDDTEREYGKPETAEKLKTTCDELGFYTVSMRDDFATIYGEDVTLSDEGDKNEIQ